MPLKEKYHKKIKEIVNRFGLYNKADGNDVKEYIFKDPSVIISELILSNEKKDLAEEEIIDYLRYRLDISKEKAEKLKKELDQEILSKEESKFSSNSDKNQKTSEDKYREPIQ